MATTATKPATMEDFLRAETEAPEGTRLALVDGEIVEWGTNLKTRKCRHGVVMAELGHVLANWLNHQTATIGVVACGEARCRMKKAPDTIVGLDVAYFKGIDHLYPDGSDPCFDGPPVVAVDILSGSDTQDDVVNRLRVFFDCGVPQVWIVDPDLRNVTIHRPSGEVSIFAAKQVLTAEPELPGFQVAVELLFPKALEKK